jgi:MSHA biogenesis protein MshJ
VLGRSRSLRLVSLKVVPPAPLPVLPAAPAAKAASPKPGASPPKPPAPLYRHAVEVEMAGTYIALVRFLEELEGIPWKLNWNGVELRAATHPEIVLRATLYTVTASPTLLKL